MSRQLMCSCVLATLLVFSFHTVSGQLQLPSNEEIYDITMKALNMTQFGLEVGTNITQTGFNASVLLACQAANIFIDKGLWGALKQLVTGKGGTYPKMEQCVDGCLYFFGATVIKPVLRIIKLAIPIKFPKPKFARVYNACYLAHQLIKNSCNLINDMKRCLMQKLGFPMKYILRHFSQWIDAGKNYFKINRGLLPLFPTVD